MSKIKIVLGGKLIDGTGKEPLDNSVVIIEGKKIKTIGKKGKVQLPQDAEIIDASGKTVMPGLIECHNHTLGERDFSGAGFKKYYDNLVSSPALPLLYSVNVLKGLLERGVTTVRIPHPTIPSAPELRGEWLVALRTAVERGYFPAPRIVAGGAVLPTGGHLNSMVPPPVLQPGWRGADGPWEVRKQTRECLAQGVDFIKLIGPGHHRSNLPTRHYDDEGSEHLSMTLEEIKAAVEEAHWKGAKVAAHVQNGLGLKYCVQAGVDTIEHGGFLYKQPDVIKLMKEKGLFWVPTMGIRFHPGYVGTVNPERTARARENFKMVHKAGVKIAAGTDNTHWEIPSLAFEIYCYVKEGGMTEMEAILTATKIAAEACGLDEVGTIEEGNLADLIIINGDPLEDIEILQDKDKIDAVIKEGTVVVSKGTYVWK